MPTEELEKKGGERTLTSKEKRLVVKENCNPFWVHEREQPLDIRNVQIFPHGDILYNFWNLENIWNKSNFHAPGILTSRE